MRCYNNFEKGCPILLEYFICYATSLIKASFNMKLNKKKKIYNNHHKVSLIASIRKLYVEKAKLYPKFTVDIPGDKKQQLCKCTVFIQ